MPEPDANPAPPAADPTPPNPAPAVPEPASEPPAPQEVVAGEPAPSLEQVHDANINALNDEGGISDPVEPEEPEEEPTEPEPVEPPVPEPNAPTPPAEEPAPVPAPEPAPVNTDSTTPGENKIAVRGFDGKTYYFNDLKEVPDDFEPASYKAWGMAVQEFTDKAANDKAHAQADKDLAEQNAAKERQDETAKAIQTSWDTDIKTLTDTKVLPTDQKAREAAVAETYQYIADQLEKGVVIDNFTSAYKSIQYDKMVAKQAEDQKKLDDAKKKNGGMVQPGGAPEAPKGRMVEAPPAGVGLDAVHQKYTHQLANT